jgi:hypothetical protein
MLTKNVKISRHLIIFSFLTMFFGLLAYPLLKSEAATPGINELNEQMQSLKSEIEQPNSPPVLMKKYERLSFLISNCSFINQLAGKNYFDYLAPASNLCINGNLAVTDPTFNRPLASSTGTGIGNGVVGNCTLSGTATAAHYDVYAFNLTSCAVFPTEVTATLCGPAGCQHLGNVDTTLLLYRNVAAGDPLTANGGLPAVFNPGSPCTNARGGQDDLGTSVGTPNNPGGATCNQVVGANCIAPCTSPSNAGGLSGFRRQLGNGRFTIVVDGFGNTTVGSYNLYIDAPAAGCTIALTSPTAANASISGRVLTAGGQGIRNVTVTLSGDSLTTPLTTQSTTFGSYRFDNLPVGQTYVVTVSAKRYFFDNPSRVISLQDNITDADFTSTEK